MRVDPPWQGTVLIKCKHRGNYTTKDHKLHVNAPGLMFPVVVPGKYIFLSRDLALRGAERNGYT